WAVRAVLSQDYEYETDGGLGMVIRQLDDGRVIVTYVVPGSPASEAGIAVRDEIVLFNGKAIDKALAEVVPWSSPFSADHVRQLEQLRYLLRSPIGTNVSITYREPGETETQTANLTSVEEQESFEYSALSGVENTTGFE